MSDGCMDPAVLFPRLAEGALERFQDARVTVAKLCRDYSPAQLYCAHAAATVFMSQGGSGEAEVGIGAARLLSLVRRRDSDGS